MDLSDQMSSLWHKTRRWDIGWDNTFSALQLAQDLWDILSQDDAYECGREGWRWTLWLRKRSCRKSVFVLFSCEKCVFWGGGGWGGGKGKDGSGFQSELICEGMKPFFRIQVVLHLVCSAAVLSSQVDVLLGASHGDGSNGEISMVTNGELNWPLCNESIHNAHRRCPVLDSYSTSALVAVSGGTMTSKVKLTSRSGMLAPKSTTVEVDNSVSRFLIDFHCKSMKRSAGLITVAFSVDEEELSFSIVKVQLLRTNRFLSFRHFQTFKLPLHSYSFL